MLTRTFWCLFQNFLKHTIGPWCILLNEMKISVDIILLVKCAHKMLIMDWILFLCCMAGLNFDIVMRFFFICHFSLQKCNYAVTWYRFAVSAVFNQAKCFSASHSQPNWEKPHLTAITTDNISVCEQNYYSYYCELCFLNQYINEMLN